MMRALSRTAVLTAALAAAAVAPRSQPAMSQSKEAAIHRLLDITGAVALAQQASAQMMTTLRPTLERSFGEAPPDLVDEFLRELQAELARADYVDLYTPVYDRHFSEKEIRDLIAFYETPAGKHAVEVMPLVVQEGMAAGQTWGEAAGRRAYERVLSRREQRTGKRQG